MSTAWLADHLDDVRVVDMRWDEDGGAGVRYAAGHIPGAVYLDWSVDLIDPEGPHAFMLAGPDRFASVMASAGIGDGTTVVAYADGYGSGPMRLWWACRVYGHDGVRVLDGGLERWVEEGRPLTTVPPEPREVRFTPRSAPGLVSDAAEVERARDDDLVVVLDLRSREQYEGRAVWFERGPVAADPDGIARTPRGELRAGRIPWARSLPWSELYLPDGRFRPREELAALLRERGVGPASRVITYCGVGISASAGLFAAHLAGVRDVALYDGSWEEWGRDPRWPVATG